MCQRGTVPVKSYCAHVEGTVAGVQGDGSRSAVADDKNHLQRPGEGLSGEGPPTQKALRPIDEPMESGSPRRWDSTPSDAAALLSRLSRGEREFKGARLAFSRFKACSLRWAILDDSDLRRSDFEGADLGYTSLCGANLSGVSLVGASLEKAVLTGADLREADVRGADFSGADLTDVDLGFAVANEQTRWPAGFEASARGVFVLGGAPVPTPTGSADDTGFTAVPPEPARYVQVTSGVCAVATSDSNLTSSLDLESEIEQTDPGLPPSPIPVPAVEAHVAFTEAVRDGQRKFPGAQLGGLRLVGANLSRLDLQGADLSSARLPRVNLRAANLRGADLRAADLQGANLVGADLRDAQLDGADLSGANLSGAMLPTEIRGLVTADARTRWPSRH